MGTTSLRDTASDSLTISELGALLRSGQMTCTALVSQTLERIERENPALNAFTFIARETALQQAGVLDKELVSGRARGPLHGIPVAVKDNIDTADMPTTYGSRFYIDHLPLHDARCIENLRRAGAVIIGKTVTSEFALGPTGEFSVQGAVHNPHDQERISGGSSAGSACAVAAGLVTCAVGSDTGGSIRIPSAYCGVVGLKPSFGAVSVKGVFPVSESLDHIGPIARTAEDAALLLAALQGVSAPTFNAAPQIRAAWIATDELVEIAPKVFETVKAHAQKCFGVGLVATQLAPGVLRQARDQVRIILLAQAYNTHKYRLAECPDDFCAPVAERVGQGAKLLACEYIDALNGRSGLQQTIAAMLENFDVLVLPTTAITAPRIGETRVEINGHICTVNDASSALTAPWNLTGYPTISVPAGMVDGLPVGMQVIARPGSDYWLLNLLGAVSHPSLT